MMLEQGNKNFDRPNTTETNTPEIKFAGVKREDRAVDVGVVGLENEGSGFRYIL
jgi:hypothetical protein